MGSQAQQGLHHVCVCVMCVFVRECVCVCSFVYLERRTLQQ
jgi:hypothetical protein